EKLKNHLDLVRQEYVKFQQKWVDLKEKYDVAVAAQGEQGEDNFVAKLLAFVADLFDKDIYSDLTIRLDGQEIKAHRFVLAARSQYWGVTDLQDVQSLDFSGIPHNVGMTLLQWVYTDKVDLTSNDDFILELLRAACKFKLEVLQTRCEEALIGSVNVRNCITYYQTAEEINAAKLKSYCSEIITTYWDDFTIDDFVGMSAPLLYKMFKSKTAYPLHAAIRNKREDIVFLYLMEFDSQLPAKLNEMDTRDDLPLDLALSTKQQSVAEELVKHKVDVDRPDKNGWCLLHKAIKRGDEFASLFLINHGATINAATHQEMQTPLHMTAGFSTNSDSHNVVQNMVIVTELLLQKGANTGQQDFQGNTVLHCAVRSRNQDVFNLLLTQSSLNLDIQNSVGDSALWIALDNTLPSTSYDSEGMPAKLIAKGASPDSVHPRTGDTLLHRCCRAENEAAALFLANQGASFSLPNNKGETALHVSSSKGQEQVVRLLLGKGANPNAQTLEDISATMDALRVHDGTEDNLMNASRQTPLHIAIANRHKDVVTAFMEHRGNAMLSMDGLQIIPNFTLADSNDQTVLALALWTGMHDLASKLLNGGADINHMTKDGMTLLHIAINKQDADSAIFLLEHQADINIRYES
ncbi:putative ankyrin repeat and FYVE domain-containing protein 1-like, partial [Apostichopus japonicus]